MTGLLVIVTIAGEKLALCSAEVQSVIDVGPLAPIPRAARHVAGLLALRSRILTAIDCNLCVGHVDRPTGGFAAVVEHDGHAYALLVESVDDVTEASSKVEPASAPLAKGWAAMTLGIVETTHGPLLLVDVSAMIAGPDDARVAA